MKNLPPHIAINALEIIRSYSKRILEENSFSKVVALMSHMAREIVGADRSTIWIADEKKGCLTMKMADGVKDRIVIEKDKGIVGESVLQKEPIIINNPYEHECFNSEIDEKLGYTTRCILTYPVFSKDGKLIAVFQLINKKDPEDLQEFLRRDLMLMDIVASFATKFLLGENYQDRFLYDQEDQLRAFSKQEAAIENELKDDKNFAVYTIHKPADVLAGDMYSILRTKDDGYLVFILDAMGHGIMPALTSYAFVSRVKKHVSRSSNLRKLAHFLANAFESVLGNEEQLSCCFVWFNKDFTQLEYLSGGMYPVGLVCGGERKYLRSNNLPFMNYTKNIKIDTMDISGFESIVLYTDGLVEDLSLSTARADIFKFLDKDFVDGVQSSLNKSDIADDATLVVIKKLV
ncbi:MAG: GAF domain-containing SpoIIE family protein phosphatase [Helicobacteraceae bacterium]